MPDRGLRTRFFLCDRYRKVIVACALILVVVGCLAALPPRMRAPVAPPPAAPGTVAGASDLLPASPSKEYIYAGAGLVAIEEAASVPTLPAPRGLEAIGYSAQVVVHWEATPGAHHYQLERADVVGPSGPEFQPVQDNIPSNSYTDSVHSHKAFLYRVRAADAAGILSHPSDADLATSITFTDNPLAGKVATGAGTAIKAAHLRELRYGVNAVRALVRLPLASYSHPDPPPSGVTVEQNTIWGPPRGIYLADVLELRAALDEALRVLDMQRPYETDPNLTGGYVKAAHFQEVRDRLK